MTSNARCANTVPTSVAHAPRSPGMWRVSTATRASSPTRPGMVAFASSPTENAEKTWMNRGCGGGTASSITVAQANARATHRDEVEADRGGQPLPLDRPERVPDLAPVRPAEVDGGRSANERGHDRPDPHPAVPGQLAKEPLHARRRAPADALGDDLVHLARAARRSSPRRSAPRRRARAAVPSRCRSGSSSSRLTTPSASAAGSPGGTSRPVSSVMTSLYPSMSDETTGTAHANARVNTIPKLSMPIDGAASTFVLSSSRCEILLAEEAEHVDPLV